MLLALWRATGIPALWQRVLTLLGAAPAAPSAISAPRAPPKAIGPLGFTGVVDRAYVARVVDEYGEAWVAKDSVRIQKIFSEHAVYAEHPYDPDRKYLGRRGIRDYWIKHVQGTEKDIEFENHKDAIVWDPETNCAMVKWEASFDKLQRDDKTYRRVGFVQVARLAFNKDGLITHLEEYWTSRSKRVKGDLGDKFVEQQELREYRTAWRRKRQVKTTLGEYIMR